MIEPTYVEEKVQMADREFWIIVRSALLMVVSAIERKWDIAPKPKL